MGILTTKRSNGSILELCKHDFANLDLLLDSLIHKNIDKV